MRLAFFTLLFVNLAYFAWAHWIDAPRAAAVNDAIAHLPRLKLVDELPPAERPQPHTTQKSALNQPPGCLSVGPFGDLANSAQAAALLKTRGFDSHQRAEQGQMSESYWVYVGDLASQAEADRALVVLEHNGIRDALVMPDTTGAGRRLSLGLYSERPRAERRAQAVRQAGLKAEIGERKLPSTLYWLDLAPPSATSTIPLHDLIAAGVNSRITVQACPPAAQTPAAPATGSATATAQPTPPVAATAGNRTGAVAGPAKLP